VSGRSAGVRPPESVARVACPGGRHGATVRPSRTGRPHCHAASQVP